jgi:hypothetical protein
VAANPERSDRAIAEEIGVSDTTVFRARKKTTASCEAVEARTGRDGKKRKPPRRPEAPVSNPIAEINAFHKELVSFLTDFSQRLTTWHQTGPLIDEDGKATLMQALYLCSDGFARLAQELDNR